ncbi:MAG: helix-turn-helix domain-containing protein [Saprospiraceae bacterium]|nr:helix-turn-helix domain-containing protein [Saprospiraceae bacterium]
MDFKYYEIAKIKTADEDLDIELHRHLFYEFFFFYGGSGKHIIDFQEYDLSLPCIQIVSPHQLHQVIQSSDSQGYVIKVKPILISSYPRINNFLNNIQYNQHFNPGVLIKENEQRLLKENCLFLNSHNNNNEDSIFALLSFINLYISILKKNQKEKDTSDNNINNVIFTEFMQLVENYYLVEKSAEFYMNKMHVSLNKLNNIVKERTGMSAKKFLIQRVLLEAKRLVVHSNKSVKEIAYDLEFLEPAHFTNYFKKHIGTSPTNFKLMFQ